MNQTKISRNFFHLCLLVLIMFLVGCAQTKWQPAITSTGEIYWPAKPDAKIRYIGEISKFQEKGTSLSSFIVGKSKGGEILKPVAISIGPNGIMAIADQDRKGVHLYNPTNENYRLIFSAGMDVITTPVGVAFDDIGNLYVTDSQLNKIFIFTPEGTFIKNISSAGGIPFNRPSGITFSPHSKRIYVSDTAHHQIVVLSRLGEFIERFGKRGEGTGSFNFPTHLGSDHHGNLFITDSMNFRVQTVSLETKKFFSFGSHGNGSGDFASPKGIGVDKTGYIYVAETLFDNVQIFSNTGQYMLSIGSQGTGTGEFWMPSGLFIDANDKLYICDTYNKRIQLFQILTDPQHKTTPEPQP